MPGDNPESVKDESPRDSAAPKTESVTSAYLGMIRRRSDTVTYCYSPKSPRNPQQDRSGRSDIDAEMAKWTGVVARWTRVLGVVSGLGVVVAVLTLLVIKGQLNEMQIEQRAWVDAPNIYMVKNSIVNYDFVIETKNVGKETALELSFYADFSNGNAELLAYCKDKKTINGPRRDGFHYSIAPDGTFKGILNVVDIIKFTTDNPDPHIIGCYFYRISADTEVHQTLFDAKVLVWKKSVDPVRAINQD